MNAKGSDDTGRFVQAIAAFSAAPEDVTEYGRRIATEREAIPKAILTEITETVLRREVCFTTDQGVVLALDVSERRIHRILKLPEALQADFTGLLDRELVPEDAGALKALFEATAKIAKTLFAKACLPDAKVAVGFKGIPVQDLHLASQIGSRLSEPENSLSAVIDKLTPELKAIYLVSDSAEPTSKGDMAFVQALAQALDSQRPPDHLCPRAFLWQPALIAGHAVLFVYTETMAFAGLCAQSSAVSHLEQFSDAFTQDTLQPRA
jgi:hypothetical protein